jgi:hypothetical protein
MHDAIELDPFREDRTAALSRYRPPGADEEADSTTAEVVERVTLVGTVLSLDGASFALCQEGDQAPRLVRPGQQIGGLLLKSVEQAKAVFLGGDGRLVTLSVPKAGPP